MANPKLTKQAADKLAAKKTTKSNLVAVKKDGETIHISPLTLENHQLLGWSLVDGNASAAEEPAEDVDVVAETLADDEPGE